MSSSAVFTGLTGQQAAGLACIVCNTPYDLDASPSVPVGVAPGHGQVFACARDCAPAVGYVPPTEQPPLEAGR